MSPGYRFFRRTVHESAAHIVTNDPDLWRVASVRRRPYTGQTSARRGQKSFRCDARQQCPRMFLRNAAVRYNPLVTVAQFRKLALSLDGAEEGSHMGNADFRVGGRIFATLSLEKEGFGVLALNPEQQAGMVNDAPEVFSPVPGGWGRMGLTRILLAKATPDVLKDALQTAWQNRITKNKGARRRA
jgi:hypothetical protein